MTARDDRDGFNGAPGSRHAALPSLERELRHAEMRRRKARLVGISTGVVFLVGASMITLVLVLGRPTANAASPPRASVADAPAAIVEPPSAESSTEPSVTLEKPEAPEVPAEPEAPEAPAGKPAAPVAPPAARKPASDTPAIQKVSIAIGDYGYEPTVVRVRAGAPVQLTVAQGDGCAAGFLIADLGVSANNSTKAAVVSLPALEAGIYRFTCGMEMVEGRLVAE